MSEDRYKMKERKVRWEKEFKEVKEKLSDKDRMKTDGIF